MKKERVNNSGRMWLQGQLQSHLFGVTKRGVTFQVQAHSDKIATVTITVAGLYGIAQNTIVIAHQQNGMLDKNGTPMYSWYGFSNGQRYTFDALSDVRSLMNQHYNTMYRVLTVSS